MKDFSVALSKIMLESPELRRLIKSEALKKVNNDTEILVAQLVEQTVDGETLFNKLDRYLTNTTMNEILNQVPTLTILVPELPEGSFSAEEWDVNTDVPVVAIRTKYSNNTPVLGINDGGEIVTDIIPSNVIPGDPILVVKLNERILSNLDVAYRELETKEFFTSRINNLSYRFTDIAFDGINYPIKTIPFPSNVDSKIADAYKKTNSKNGWQRDYIYYDIVEDNDKGELDYKFQERLMFIRPIENNGSAQASYDIFTDATDPQYRGTLSGGNWNQWTEGTYEFSFNFILTGGKDSGTGKKIDKRFGASPTDLFSITYQHHSSGTWFWKRNWYTITSIKAKKLVVDLDLFTWDLYNFGADMMVQAYEIDPSQTIKETRTHSSQVAGNFGFEFNLLKKIGVKLGGNAQQNKSTTVEISTTLTSNDLGNAFIYFKDPVVTGLQGGSGFFRINNYNLNEYSVAGLKFNVMPKRIQQ